MAGPMSFYLLQIGNGAAVHPKGTILEVDRNQLPGVCIVPDQILLVTVCRRPITESSIVEVIYQPNKLKILNEPDFLLLLPVPCNERSAVYLNAEWMDEGRNMQEGHRVQVTLYDQSQAIGTVRYIGVIFDNNEGMYFGIELDRNYEGRGICDGSFLEVRRFRCRDNLGVFCPLSRIRILKNSQRKEEFVKPEEDQSAQPIQICEQKGTLLEDPHKEKIKPSFSMPKPLTFLEKPLGEPSDPRSSKDVQKNQKMSETSLVVGERVVHLTDSGTELATVKWIGTLPGRAGTLFAGVQFDNPVGTGTGKFGEEEYFKTEKGYASFIPLEGLIKAKDMAGEEPKQKTCIPVPSISLGDLMHEKPKHPMFGVIEWRSNEFKPDVALSTLELDSTLPLLEKTSSLPDDEGSANIRCSIHVVSLLPIFESFKESPQSPTQMDCLRQFIYRTWNDSQKLGYFDAQAVLDLKNILAEIYSLKLPNDDSILTTSLKLFGACYELDRVRSMLVKPPEKYVLLEDMLRDSEEISLFSNHFVGTSIYMVAVGEMIAKNLIIPSLTLDFASIFLSCRACKENLHCPKCKSNQLPAFVCRDCLAEKQSLRLSLFCKYCFQAFHQNCNMQHFKQELINADEFEKVSPYKQLTEHSLMSDKESCTEKMELFAIISSIGGIQKIFGKTGLEKEAEWFLLQQNGMRQPLSELDTFLKSYSTSPSTCFDPIFQEMLDGLKICYYRSCDQ